MRGKKSITVVLAFVTALTFACASKPKQEKPAEAPVATAQQKLGVVKLQKPTGDEGAPAQLAKIPQDKKAEKKSEKKKEVGLPVLPAPSMPSESALEPDKIPFQPKLIKEAPSIEILIDASGSMNAPFGLANEIKMNIIETAVIDALRSLTDSFEDFPRNVAIRVFGSEKTADEKDCQDSKLIYPLGKPDMNQIVDLLENITAKGMSPLSFAIKQTENDMAKAGQDKVLVIIADGTDNCGGDVFKEAETLNKAGQKWIFHIVGFDMSPEDQEIAKSLAQKTSGKFFIARTIDELYTSVDEAINSSIPYNLRLVTHAANLPVPVDFTVYRAGTRQIIKKDKSFGTKLLLLKPGSYDITVEYAESAEIKRPSKLIKGVEVTSGTKVEQTINFDLGGLGLTAIDSRGYTAPARYQIFEAGTKNMAAEFSTKAPRSVFFLTPGKYDVSSELLGGDTSFAIKQTGITLTAGKTDDLEFKFQKGTLILSSETTIKHPIPFIFRVYSSQEPDKLIASGALPSDGGSLELYPGIYDLILIGDSARLEAEPRTKLSEVNIKAGDTTKLSATFKVGELKLIAKTPEGNALPALFSLFDEKTNQPLGEENSDGKKITFLVPPGTYKVRVTSTIGIAEPKPSIVEKGIVVTEKKATDRTILFKLGVLRLRGINTKEQYLTTKFSIFFAGTDELASSAPQTGDWVEFPLSPGKYDVEATNTTGPDLSASTLWIRDTSVVEGKTLSLDAIFTAGKIKIIGRGPNNAIINCKFKIFKYGADREIISGVTGNDWQNYPIEPGDYYMEAGFNDPIASVMLKKWVNLSVDENEVKEIVLRF